MPLFDYRCKNCNAEFEALVQDSNKPACPKCNSKKLEKQLSIFAAGSSNTTAPCGADAKDGSCGFNAEVP